MSSVEIETITDRVTSIAPGRRGIAKDATIISIANVTSRVLGLVRETVFANQFGASVAFSAFGAALVIPKMIQDMLMGGLLSSALVPVFSDKTEDKTELWGAVSVVLGVATVLVAGVALLAELFAPALAGVLVSGFDAQGQALATRLIRLMAPAVMFMSITGVLTGLLYALKRFTFAAFAAAVYNLGLIVGAVVLTQFFEGPARIYGLGLGVVLGAVGQVLLLLPDLRDQKVRFRIDWQHPVLRRIAKLYLPIALGFVVSNIGIVIDRSLASTTGGESISWMNYATTLVQLPLGLVATAISLAVLPSLSQLASDEKYADYRRTLFTGVRMVLVLIIPATIGLFVLAEPTVTLLFERGQFTPFDTLWTSRALQIYLLGLTFAAIDQVLVFGYYARQNTLTPALVGVAAVGIYLSVALPLVRVWGMLALVLANSIQWLGHAAIMLVLTQRSVGGLGRGGVVITAAKALIASVIMGGAAFLALQLLRSYAVPGILGDVLLVLVPAGIGAGVYALMSVLLKLDEAWGVVNLIRSRLE